MKLAKIVIIGAGLTGLSVAYHLEKKGFFDYQIFEKESEIGGLCRSIYQDGFTFDFTGHLLHINDPYFESFIKKIIGFEYFNQITRHSFIFSHDTHTQYPFQTNLYGLPEDVITDCIEGFINKPTIKNPKNYYQCVVTHFGTGFGKRFFFPYQKKIFCTEPKNLAHSWTGRFVPRTTLAQIIHGALTNQQKEKIGYNATFLYPKRGGISLLIEKLQKQLIVPVKKNFCAQTIDLKNKLVHFSNGHTESFDQLINTMPLDLFLQSLTDRSTTDFQRSHKKLRCTSVLNFNLGIARENIADKSWIYYPEAQFPFYRIGFPHTFCRNMTPPRCSSLYGEIGYKKEHTNAIDKKLDDALTKVKKLFKIGDQEIVTKNILHIAHAYVIYNTWREKNLSTLLANLAEYDIHSTGRYGAWKYASMQEAILDGKKTVEKLLKEEFTFTPQKLEKHEAVL